MAKLEKIRCFVIDDTTGRPRGGVAVSLIADGDAGPRALGLLVSDRAGYLAFDLSHTTLAKGETKLWLTPLGEPKSRLDVLAHSSGTSVAADTSATHVAGSLGTHVSVPPSTSSLSPTCFPFLLRVESASEITTAQDDCGTAVLPAVQSPDPCDYRLSPGSFVTSVSKLLGEGCCESLVPSTLPVQEYILRRVITRGPSPAVPSGAAGWAKSGPIDVTTLPKAQVTTIGFGEVLQFRQEWFGLGHALGEIRYSLALAPGEAKEIAVVDWSRQDQASRTDAITSTEYLANQLNRDRSIGETVNSMLSEQQLGFSGMIGTAGAGSYSGGQYNAAADNSMGNAIGYSSGQRNLEADSLQALHDSTNQATAVVRTLNSTVVMQSTQAEQNVLQTRRVANHNHCHALTIEYYEVLRHYLMRTAFDGRRPAILIPFQPFDFTPALALRFRMILVPSLLDPSLKSAFDATMRHEHYSYPPPKTSSTPNYFTGPKTLTVDPSEPLDTGLYIQKDSLVRMLASGTASFNQGGVNIPRFDPDGDGVVAVDDANHQWYAPGKTQFSLVCRLGTTWFQGAKSTEFPADADNYLVMQANDVKGQLSDNTGLWTVQLTVLAPTGATTGPTPPSTGDDSTQPFSKDGDKFAEDVLIEQLNGNRGYYNRVVWLGMDDSDRRLYIDYALAPFPGLTAAVDSTPLACSGNVVAFAYEGDAPNWSDTRLEDPKEPIESIVTLPTRGVFAEAMLGHCNGCEVRDVTRMWDWTEATEEEPPPIQNVTPGPRGTPDTVTPTTLPQAVVQISQPPAAPDPVGLAAALRVMGTPNIFRDMSGLQELGSLLNTLTNGAVTSLAGAQKVGQQAQQKIQAMQAQQGQADVATNGTSQKQTPAERYDNLQVAKEVAKSADELGLTDQQKADLSQDIIGGGGGGGVTAQLLNTILGAAPVAKAWPKLDRITVLTRLKDLKGNANLFDQGSIGLCTAAAFYHHVIQKDPLQFYAFASGLYGQGIGFLGQLKIAPGDSLRNSDYDALGKKFNTMPPQADWMLMSALRDSENWFFDFEGVPDEATAMRTSAGEMSDWYKNTGFYSSVDYSSDKSLAEIKTIQKSANNHIALWIEIKLLGDPRDGTHMITLESPMMIDEVNNKVTFNYWTWGQPVKALDTTVDALKAHYRGVITATF